MKRTPIDIRGKRGKRKAIKRINDEYVAEHALREIGQVPDLFGKDGGGDCLSYPSTTTYTLKAHEPLGPNPKLTTPCGRPLSALELLPVEILGQIFMNCLNMNLPLATMLLGQKLSGMSIKRDYFLEIVKMKDPDDLRAMQVFPEDLEKTTYGCGSPKDLLDFISKVMDTRWLTWKFMCETQILRHFSRHLSRRNYRNIPFDLSKIPYRMKCIENVHIKQLHGLPIPAKLLIPPMTEDKSRMLEFLIDSRCNVHFHYAYPVAESLEAACRDALEKGDYLTLARLMRRGIDVFDDDRKIGSYDVGLRIPVNDLYKIMYDDGSYEDILIYILSAPRPTINSRDAEVHPPLNQWLERLRCKDFMGGMALTSAFRKYRGEV